MRNAIKTIIFIAIVCLLLFAIEPIFIPYQEQDTNQSATYYKTPENSVDVFITGGSMTMVAVSPLIIFEETGITAHNRGSSRQIPELSYLNVKECFKKHSPKLVIWNASTLVNSTDVDKDETFIRRGMDYRKLSWDKMLMAREITNQSKWQEIESYLFPLIRYHDVWPMVLENYKEKNSKEKYDYLHGQFPVYKHLFVANDANERMKNTKKIELVKRGKKWAKIASQICKRNGCEFMLLEMPDSRWTMGKHIAVQDFADELGVKFIDFNTDNLMEKCNISWEDDFYEGHHLNVKGSVKATKYISKIMTDYYGLKSSDVSDEIKNQFRQDLKLFRRDMKTIKYKEVKQ